MYTAQGLYNALHTVSISQATTKQSTHTVLTSCHKHPRGIGAKTKIKKRRVDALGTRHIFRFCDSENATTYYCFYDCDNVTNFRPGNL